MESIDEVVESLGKILEIQTKVDSQAGFQFIKKQTVRFRIESDADVNWVNIVADLGELPPGPYRRTLFKAALSANRKDEGPRYGIIAFSEANRHVMMFDKLMLHHITEDFLKEFLTPFMDKACEWHEHIAAGSIPNSSSSRGDNPFGM